MVANPRHCHNPNLEKKMEAYKKYGIKVGSVYAAADGSPRRVVVKDVETYAAADDVVVYDELDKVERRIDAFKLAMVRYYLCQNV